MVDNAVIFGADRKRAEEEMKDALEFEIKLANVIFKNKFFIKKAEDKKVFFSTDFIAP